MENENQEQPVTLLLPIEVAAPELPAPVIIENVTTIEQTPENNTKWQEEIVSILRSAQVTSQEQTAQLIQMLQQHRELLTLIQDCQLRTETALMQLTLKLQPQEIAPITPTPTPEPEPAPALEVIPENLPPELPTPQSEQSERKRLRKI